MPLTYDRLKVHDLDDWECLHSCTAVSYLQQIFNCDCSLYVMKSSDYICSTIQRVITLLKYSIFLNYYIFLSVWSIVVCVYSFGCEYQRKMYFYIHLLDLKKGNKSMNLIKNLKFCYCECCLQSGPFSAKYFETLWWQTVENTKSY